MCRVGSDAYFAHPMTVASSVHSQRVLTSPVSCVGFSRTRTVSDMSHPVTNRGRCRRSRDSGHYVSLRYSIVICYIYVETSSLYHKVGQTYRLLYAGQRSGKSARSTFVRSPVQIQGSQGSNKLCPDKNHHWTLGTNS